MKRLRDTCGVVGIYTAVGTNNHEEIDVRRYLALTALQHRGQESAGMAVYDDQGHIVSRIKMGKVRGVFPDSGTNLLF